jgi:hypothetical protein
MREKSDASQNCAVRVIPMAPWRVTQVQLSSETAFCFVVKFTDGTSGKVNMAKLISSNYAGIFANLRDQALFNQVCIKLGAVTWPGEIDLAPDAMYDAIKKNGEWVL